MREVILQAGAAAFGTGQHPTTMLALQAMFALKEGGGEFRRILDMGCGSGILSLVAKRLWPQAGVLAVDSEAAALEAAQANAEENGVEGIRFLRSEGFAHREVAEGAPYDLVLCNIFAEPILRMAAPMSQAAVGILVLSGILPWLEEQVTDAYGQAGFIHRRTLAQEQWRCLVMEKSGAA
ncbi:MAG: 50S ribosomal protein L11 methyltransferase [Alphaproteobacteria bacterium]|nr:50S ribosomal protein L11 methyltransferase [Alphaproteobacteria bacterium]